MESKKEILIKELSGLGEEKIFKQIEEGLDKLKVPYSYLEISDLVYNDTIIEDLEITLDLEVCGQHPNSTKINTRVRFDLDDILQIIFENIDFGETFYHQIDESLDNELDILIDDYAEGHYKGDKFELARQLNVAFEWYL